MENNIRYSQEEIVTLLGIIETFAFETKLMDRREYNVALRLFNALTAENQQLWEKDFEKWEEEVTKIEKMGNAAYLYQNIKPTILQEATLHITRTKLPDSD